MEVWTREPSSGAVASEAVSTSYRLRCRHFLRTQSAPSIPISQQEETLVWGPYKDGPTKFRLKITENGATRNVGFKTEKEAKVVKAKLLGRESQRRKRTIGAKANRGTGRTPLPKGIHGDESEHWQATGGGDASCSTVSGTTVLRMVATGRVLQAQSVRGGTAGRACQCW